MEKNYGGAVWDVGNAVVETSDGYVIAGFQIAQAFHLEIQIFYYLK